MTVLAIAPGPLSQLTYQGARLRTDRLRGRLATAWNELEWLVEREAWAVLGYDSIGDWMQAEFGDLRLVKLSTDQRRELVGAMKSQGMSVRAISRALGVSPTTVQADARPEPVARLRVVEQVGAKTDAIVAYAIERGEAGVTTPDLMERFGWKQSQASGALSRAKRQQRVRVTAVHRDGYGVHVAG